MKNRHARRWIRGWLIVIGLMVYAMILIGGATRLTDSGLSITEWSPLRGALPPMGEAAWAELFEKYKTTSEYKLQNRGMSLAEFQYIFWWEWGHRLFGRLIGLVAIAGFVLFWARGWLSRALSLRLLLLISLGGLQGFIGWWMVASGIGETARVDVAPYRLMTHFCLALLILSLTMWTWLALDGDGQGQPIDGPPGARLAAFALLALVSVQLASGALVAGLDAGRSYTDWPLMAGEVFPSDYIGDGLGIRSLFEGRAATQFNHRFLAYLLLGSACLAYWFYRRSALAGAFGVVMALVSVQAVWGILTLLNAAPLNMALLHQAFGVLILLASVRLAWRAAKVQGQTMVLAQPAQF
ncbi:MAG: COX15/CtaA family protein [Pseudomonadota bacterium]